MEKESSIIDITNFFIVDDEYSNPLLHPLSLATVHHHHQKHHVHDSDSQLGSFRPSHPMYLTQLISRL